MADQPLTEVWATLAGPVDQLMVQKVFQASANITAQKIETVHLLIQSTGGFIGDGICLYNFLKNLPINLITYNIGNVASVAVIVYLAGKHRISTANATFLIHKSRTSAGQGVTASALKEILGSLETDNSRVDEILRENLTLPDEKWLLHENGDLTISAKEAKDFALVHQIDHFAPPQNAPFFSIN